MQNSMNNKIQSSKSKMVQLITKLDSLSPLKTLTRGYSIVQKEGKLVKSTTDVLVGDSVDIRLIDGNIKAKVYE